MVGDRFFTSDVVANALVGTLAISARIVVIISANDLSTSDFSAG